MKKNKELLIKTINKYENHLNINVKLMCNQTIIYDTLKYESITRIRFNIQGREYWLMSDSNVDLDLIRIAIEEYLIEDNYVIKALKNELNDYEYSILKDSFNEDIYSLVLIQTEKKNEYLYSTILNIFEGYCIEFEDKIIVISSNEYENQFLYEVKNTIESELYSNVYISTTKLYDLKELSNCYKELCYFIELSKKYKLENNIINSSSLLLPYIMDNIHSEKINSIKEYIHINKIKELDEELLMTILMFFKCNLSISETARKMYIHRNTLIYRIEKILIITGYDIRNFNDALKIEIGMILMKK